MVSNFFLVSQALMFKIRKSSPCWLTRVCYDMDVPEDDTIQVRVYVNLEWGMGICLGQLWGGTCHYE